MLPNKLSPPDSTPCHDRHWVHIHASVDWLCFKWLGWGQLDLALNCGLDPHLFYRPLISPWARSYKGNSHSEMWEYETATKLQALFASYVLMSHWPRPKLRGRNVYATPHKTMPRMWIYYNIEEWRIGSNNWVNHTIPRSFQCSSYNIVLRPLLSEELSSEHGHVSLYSFDDALGPMAI